MGYVFIVEIYTLQATNDYFVRFVSKYCRNFIETPASSWTHFCLKMSSAVKSEKFIIASTVGASIVQDIFREDVVASTVWPGILLIITTNWLGLSKTHQLR